MEKSELVRSLQNVERQFKPMVLNYSNISTSELNNICSIYLNDNISLNALIFSFHQLKSTIPWKYEPSPSWLDYNYICPHYQKHYKIAVDIDNRITRNNTGISFSYELLQLKETSFENQRIIVRVSFVETTSECEVTVEDYNVDTVLIHIRISSLFNIKQIDAFNNSLISSLHGVLALKLQQTLGGRVGDSGMENKYSVTNLAYAIIASLPYISLADSVLFILSDIVSFEHNTYGLGGMFVVIKDSVISEEVMDILSRIGDTMAIRFVQHYLFKLVQSESIKSAVSAIMTRNMSHNLGSHYLYYTKTHLDNLARRGGNIGPDIRGAARVMEYMQGRMDYLATIVSMDRYPYGCVNFKSQIYDVLTIDNFSKRHFQSNGSSVSRNVLEMVDELLEEMMSADEIDRTHLERMNKLTQDALDDNKNKRTTNFLLTNLILSEGFTRLNIADDVQDGVKTINIYVWYNNQLFTGLADKIEEENGVKEQLTKLNIAMPGGVMSCHAFFNIIENFIRNSAKYLQADFKEEGLTVTIKIEEKEGVKDRYYFTIYDNKQNANKPLPKEDKSQQDTPDTTLIESIKNRLGSLQILDDNNAVEKSNKGFKEMLFSAIWMQSYIYSNKQGQGNLGSYADVLNAIHSATTGDEKLDLITEYAFSIVAVDDNGNECGTDTKGNLGLRFALPKFQNYIDLNISGDYNSINTDINSLLNVYGDIAYVDKVKLESFIGNLKKRDDKININPLLVIPRMINDKPENDIDALKQVLYKRFGEEEFNKYKLRFASGEDEKYKQADDKYRIYFQQHLSSKGDMSSFRYYAYADSVSGGNFTLTLSEIASRWDGNDNYEILKIKESALTRITFIDERLFDKMERQGIATELSCKNIRVLNYKEPELQADEPIDFMKMFTGNEFNRGGNATHFLSIHLGLVEKIIQDSTFFNSMTDEKGKKYSSQDSKTRTTAFMRLLKEYFGPEVFISIHSGRGNFSAELEGPLSVYPFISMAAIENTFDNSKYLLCQLFYSTIYLGKGVANKKS